MTAVYFDACYRIVFRALVLFSERELDRKEKKALMEATRAWAQINRRATAEGQAIFDLFTKT